METEPTPTVYSWYMPEVAQVVHDLIWYMEYPESLYHQNYDPGLDDAHKGLMRLAQSTILPEVFDEDGLERLNAYHNYYTNGSSEGIFHLLARHKAHFGSSVPLYQFEGEYQGYNEYAKSLGLHFDTIPLSGIDVEKLYPGVFFMSAPSAIDGNNVSSEVVERITRRHYIVLDVAYAGMSDIPGREDIKDLMTANDRVAAVVASMSKPFGLYYYRIGFLWTRDPVMSLYGNKWFKNIWSITVGENVLQRHTAAELEKKYRPWQTRACAEASDRLGVEIKPSDAWLLGHYYPNTQDRVPASLSPFKRGVAYRFCLTPYYMSYVNDETS